MLRKLKQKKEKRKIAWDRNNNIMYFFAYSYSLPLSFLFLFLFLFFTEKDNAQSYNGKTTKMVQKWNLKGQYRGYERLVLVLLKNQSFITNGRL